MSLQLGLQPTAFFTQGVGAVASSDLVFPSLFKVADVSIACGKDKCIGAFLRSTRRVSTRCDFVFEKDILFVRAKKWHREDLLCVEKCVGKLVASAL